jgi:rhamnogalacturonyl hydrolase YesR
MRCLGVTAGLLLLAHQLTAQQPARTTEQVLRTVADRVLVDATFEFIDQSGQRYATPAAAPAGARLRPASAYHDWRYWNGVLALALLELSAALKEPKYGEFAARNVAFGFEHAPWFQSSYDGDKWNFPFAQHFVMNELDDYGAMGAATIEVWRRDPQPRYRDYVERAAAYARTRQGRLEDGTLVRGFPHRWTLWTDDLFMGVPFLARMAELSGDASYLDDAARQVINYHRYVFDERAGVMRHFWYSDLDRQGPAAWGRANGWALLAQVQLLDRLPAAHMARDTLLALLHRHILGIARWQGGEGLWHQLLDRPDSYLETSASAMFTYAIARAVNRGYLEPRYASIAHRGWEGVMSRVRADGQIEGICAGTSTSDDLVYYYRRPTPLNDVHGIGTILMAGTEVLRLPR